MMVVLMVWKWNTPCHQTILIFLFVEHLHLKLYGMSFSCLDKRCNLAVALGKESSRVLILFRCMTNSHTYPVQEMTCEWQGWSKWNIYQSVSVSIPRISSLFFLSLKTVNPKCRAFRICLLSHSFCTTSVK